MRHVRVCVGCAVWRLCVSVQDNCGCTQCCCVGSEITKKQSQLLACAAAQIAADKCNARAFTLCSQVLDQCNALWCRALPLWHMASPPPPSSALVLCDCSCTVHGTALPVAHCFIQQQKILYLVSLNMENALIEQERVPGMHD